MTLLHESFAVIFDMDGVLVDSYAAHLANWLQLGQELGYPYTEADFQKDFGRTGREVLSETWSKSVPGLTPERILELDARKEALYRSIISRQFPAMDGARELIDELAAARVPIAIGSSGPRGNVELILDKLELRETVAATVSGADVVRGKPDPQVFLLAAQQLGLAPGRCVVIEDSRPGILAARAAGMKCIGLVSTGHTPPELAEADLVVLSLRDVSVAVVAGLVETASGLS